MGERGRRTWTVASEAFTDGNGFVGWIGFAVSVATMAGAAAGKYGIGWGFASVCAFAACLLFVRAYRLQKRVDQLILDLKDAETDSDRRQTDFWARLVEWDEAVTQNEANERAAARDAEREAARLKRLNERPANYARLLALLDEGDAIVGAEFDIDRDMWSEAQTWAKSARYYAALVFDDMSEWPNLDPLRMTLHGYSPVEVAFARWQTARPVLAALIPKVRRFVADRPLDL